MTPEPGGRQSAVFVVPAVAESVGRARRWLVGFLHGCGVVGTGASDVVIALSELVTNVVLHGDGDVVCHASVLDGGRCCVAVLDAGTGKPVVVAPGERRVGGLGLLIVERTALDWGVVEFPGAKTVWAVFSTGDDWVRRERSVAC